MRKSKFFLTLLTLLTFSVGMWAVDATDTIAMKGFGGLSATSYQNVTVSGTSAKGVSMVAYAFNPSSGQVRGSKTAVAGESVSSSDNGKNWSLYNSAAMPGAIKAIKVTQTGTGDNIFQNHLYVALGKSGQGNVTAITSAQKQDDGGTATEITFTIDGTKGYTYFKLLSTEKFTSGSTVDVKVYVTYVAPPTVTLTPKALNFETIKHGEEMTPQNFTVEGENLTGALTITSDDLFPATVTSGSLTPTDGKVSATVTVSPKTTTPGAYTDGTYNVKVNGGGLGTDTAKVGLYMIVGYELGIAAADDEQGTAKLNGGTESIAAYANATAMDITATAAPGYKFKNWTVLPVGAVTFYDENSPETSISEITDDAVVYANFEEDQCTQLAVPELAGPATISYNLIKFDWEAVANADAYIVNVWEGDDESAYMENQRIESVEPLTFTYSALQAETEYHYSIMAIGDGTTYCDNNNKLSATFTTLPYPDATLTLSENGEEREYMPGIKVHDQIKLPTEALIGIEGKVLVGWSTVAIPSASDKPTSGYYELGADYTIQSENDKLYAVYATEAEGTPSTWEIKASDLADLNGGSGYGKYAGDQQKDGIIYNITAVMPSSSNLQFQANNGRIYNKTAFATEITSIKLTGTALTVYEGEDEISTTPEDGDIDGDLSGVYAFSKGMRYFRLEHKKSGAATLSSILVNLRGALTYSDYITQGVKTIPAPTFDVEEGEFVGSMNVGLTCALDGAKIYYTIDGATPNVDDPENIIGIEYTAPFKLETTATVMAIAVKDGNKSAVAEKMYSCIPLKSCADIPTTPDDEKLALNEVVVTYANGNNVWVKDATGSSLIYGSAYKDKFAQGDVVNGVVGTRASYQELVAQVSPVTAFENLTVTHGAAPEPEELTSAPSPQDINRYVIMKNVTVDEDAEFVSTNPSTITFSLNASDVAVYNNFRLKYEFKADKTYNIIGVVSYFKNQSLTQVYFISATDSSTAIDNTEAGVKANKVLRDGQLLIEKNGTIYNVQGQSVR